jgi:hypothetical protein
METAADVEGWGVQKQPAMWNPTFETLFLLVGKLIALQF